MPALVFTYGEDRTAKAEVGLQGFGRLDFTQSRLARLKASRTLP